MKIPYRFTPFREGNKKVKLIERHVLFVKWINEKLNNKPQQEKDYETNK